MSDDPRSYVVNREQVEEARERATSGHRSQKTFYLTNEIIQRVNGAVYWSLPLALAKAGGDGAAVDTDQIPDSASALVEAALWAEVLRLEHVFNGGSPFAPAPGKLRTGPGQRGAARLSDGEGH